LILFLKAQPTTVTELSYIFDEAKNSILYNLLCNCSRVLADLKSTLKTKNFELIRDETAGKPIFKVLKASSPNDIGQIDDLIEEFTSVNSFVYDLIDKPDDIDNNICHDMKHDYAFIHEKNGFFEFYGDKDTLNEVRNRLAMLSREKTAKQDPIILRVSDDPRVNVLFHFGGVYLDHLRAELNNFFLKCELCPDKLEVIIEPIACTQFDSDEVLNDVKMFLSRFKTSECNLKTFGTLNVATDVHVEKCGANQIRVCGLTENVDEYLNRLSESCEESELAGFSLNEGRILFACEYRSLMEEQYPGLTLKIDTKKSKILYQSKTAEHIEQAKKYAREIFAQVVKVKFLCDPVQKEFMLQNERSLIAFLRDNKFLCVFDLKDPLDSVYHIYAISKDAIKKCYDTFTSDILVKKYNLDDKFKVKVNTFLTYMESEKIWNGTNTPTGFIAKKTDAQTFCICGFRETAEAVDKKFRDYIEGVIH
jgi:hypothetical protein